MFARHPAACRAVLTVALSTIAAAPAVAQVSDAADCWHADELTAARVGDLQSTLMVLALKCHDTAPDTVAAFNKFMADKRAVVLKDRHLVEAHFVRSLGPVEGMRASAAYDTRLGNQSSAPDISVAQCERAASYARLADAGGEDDLPVLAGLVAVPSSLAACPTAAPAPTRPAGMVIQTWARPAPPAPPAAAYAPPAPGYGPGGYYGPAGYGRGYPPAGYGRAPYGYGPYAPRYGYGPAPRAPYAQPAPAEAAPVPEPAVAAVAPAPVAAPAPAPLTPVAAETAPLRPAEVKRIVPDEPATLEPIDGPAVRPAVAVAAVAPAPVKAPHKAAAAPATNADAVKALQAAVAALSQVAASLQTAPAAKAPEPAEVD